MRSISSAERPSSLEALRYNGSVALRPSTRGNISLFFSRKISFRVFLWYFSNPVASKLCSFMIYKAAVKRVGIIALLTGLIRASNVPKKPRWDDAKLPISTISFRSTKRFVRFRRNSSMGRSRYCSRKSALLWPVDTSLAPLPRHFPAHDLFGHGL